MPAINTVLQHLDDLVAAADLAIVAALGRAATYDARAADATRRAEAATRQLGTDRAAVATAEGDGSAPAAVAAKRATLAASLKAETDTRDEAEGLRKAAAAERDNAAAWARRKAQAGGFRVQGDLAGRQREAIKAALDAPAQVAAVVRAIDDAKLHLGPVLTRLKGQLTAVDAEATVLLDWLLQSRTRAAGAYSVPPAPVGGLAGGEADLKRQSDAAEAFALQGVATANGDHERLRAITLAPPRLTPAETGELTALMVALPAAVPAAPTDPERAALLACLARLPDAYLADFETYTAVNAELTALTAYHAGLAAARADLDTAESTLKAAHDAVLGAAPVAPAAVPDAAAAIALARTGVAPSLRAERSAAALRFAHTL